MSRMQRAIGPNSSASIDPDGTDRSRCMPNAPSPDIRASSAGHLWGGGVLALYVLLIAYASLYPFAGWRIPAEGWWQILWSRYNPEFDVVINFISYAPLGFLAASAWSRRFTALRAMALAILSGAALSMAMEGLQPVS